MSSYHPPCVEMRIPVSVHREISKNNGGVEKGKLKLYLSYTTEDFQEIVNVKAFDVETLWSSVGGFIGIFLGYSLLQIPEILTVLWNRSWGRFALLSWIECVCALIIPVHILKSMCVCVK